MLKSKNYKFINLPKRYALEDYKQAIDHIVRKYSKVKGLMSIYSWGDISIPGISDIDFVFVFKDSGAVSLPLLKRSFYLMGPKLRYIVYHPSIFIDEKCFKNIRCLYPYTNFKLVCGKNIKIKKLSYEDNYHASISLLNDIIIRHYPRDFLKQFVNRVIDVRGTLLRLNSLKYSIRLLEGMTKEKNGQWMEKLKLIEKTRKEWFSLNDFNLLTLLNSEALKIAMNITENFTEFLREKEIVKIDSGVQVRYCGIKNKSLFINRWDRKKTFEVMSKHVNNKKESFSILPLELAAQLIEYSKYKGRISNYIREEITNNVQYEIKHKNIIKKRIDILNSQAKLATKLKHSDFAAFFDFGYRNKSGINNWAVKLVDKIRF